MKIETDRAEVVSGVRHSQTIGSPIAIIIRNTDWKNWTENLPVEGGDPATPQAGHSPPSRPCRPRRSDQVRLSRRPLHPGARQRPGNDGPRVAIGAIAKQFLGQFGIEVLSHVIAVGQRAAGAPGHRGTNWSSLAKKTKFCWAASTRKPSSG